MYVFLHHLPIGRTFPGGFCTFLFLEHQRTDTDYRLIVIYTMSGLFFFSPNFQSTLTMHNALRTVVWGMNISNSIENGINWVYAPIHQISILRSSGSSNSEQNHKQLVREYSDLLLGVHALQNSHCNIILILGIGMHGEKMERKAIGKRFSHEKEVITAKSVNIPVHKICEICVYINILMPSHRSMTAIGMLDIVSVHITNNNLAAGIFIHPN